MKCQIPDRSLQESSPRGQSWFLFDSGQERLKKVTKLVRNNLVHFTGASVAEEEDNPFQAILDGVLEKVTTRVQELPLKRRQHEISQAKR